MRTILPLLLIFAALPLPRVLALDGKELDDPARFRWVRSILDRIVEQTGWKRGQIKLTLPGSAAGVTIQRSLLRV
jgi:hypothetical protein